jgi:hypothetical protein
VWSDIRGDGSDQASAPQLVGAITVAVLLVVGACTFGRWTLPPRIDVVVPRPLLVLGLAFLAFGGYQLIPATWLGVAGGIAILLVAGLLLTHWSRSASWGQRHVAAVAGAAVVSRALVGFASVATTTPRPPGGFAQNTVLLILSMALVGASVRRRLPRA